ncbi:mitochondrial protein-like protein Fmp25 [Lophium mytilinum]|uniref:Mitochondrial protein-like protein Fmp25 n=1 Tax=Lophium mytilinum TaxID=390894 RepID=A0A6A6R8I8_9PEZI|nr:mitochondrial protein-like protein Fmp25 [Lophium mytilinum]
MLTTRCLPRARPRIYKNPRTSSMRTFTTRTRNNSNTRIAIHPYAHRRQRHFVRSIVAVTTLGALATVLQWASGGNLYRDAHAEAPEEPEIEFEKARRKATSKEDNRALISSQHLQVKKSWENPGVYAWGSNAGKVVAPDSDEAFIKTPRRIPFFDGKLLRDIKLDKTFAAAIDEKGDLLQWGTGFSKDTAQPTKTLRGKSLTSINLSRDRILALSSNGTVYSIPASQEEQETGPKPSSSSWAFWTSSNDISYRTLTPPTLSRGERITSVATGLEHTLLLSSAGRLFTAASASVDFPARGQLGIPGLTWQTRPPGAYDQCHEVITLRGFSIAQIAAGDYHSLAADREGRVFAFGDNSYGQLGFDFSADSTFVDAPSLLPIQKLYAGTSQVPSVKGVFAGGSSSFFTVDATKMASPDSSELDLKTVGKVTADTLACGHGIWGQLGTGRWTHVQTSPTKIPSLSGLFEYDEKTNSVVPIRLSRFSVGANHAAAVMDNVTHLAASKWSSENDTNWGADILFFGNNEYYQLGTGKRNNVAQPVYIQPLDAGAEKKLKGEQHRFQITPKNKVNVGGRTVQLEQRVECGRGCTAVYSGV